MKPFHIHQVANQVDKTQAEYQHQLLDNYPIIQAGAFQWPSMEAPSNLLSGHNAIIDTKDALLTVRHNASYWSMEKELSYAGVEAPVLNLNAEEQPHVIRTPQDGMLPPILHETTPLASFSMLDPNTKKSEVQCDECGKAFASNWRLEAHGPESGHLPFGCTFDGCDQKYSRPDSRERHHLSHSEAHNLYPCTHCAKYAGNKGFKRRDHLRQHLRGYHHIGNDTVPSRAASCPHVSCSCYRAAAYADNGNPRRYRLEEGAHAFPSRKLFQEHMRKVHDETPFQCPAARCERKGAKGWFRPSDFVKHHRKEHEGEIPVIDALKWYRRR